MYRVTCKYGNGYRCSCCRQTWERQEEFETKEEVLKFLIEFEVSRIEASNQDSGRSNDDADKWISEIVIVEDDYLTEKFMEEIKNKVTKITEDKKQKREEARRIKVIAQKRANVTKEKKRLKALAKKYPEELKKTKGEENER